MNLQPVFTSMFFFRLKNEFAENRKPVLILWGILGIILWTFFQWWRDPLADPDTRQSGVAEFSFLGVGIVAFFLVTTLFKRDDLKHPQEFWVTRPLRSNTVFGAKLVFVWLVLVLPCAVLTGLSGWIAGVGDSAAWNGLEMMLWAGCAANLLSLSCMAHPGNRGLLGVLCFFGGVVGTGIVLGNMDPVLLGGRHPVGDAQRQWNMIVVSVGLNLWTGWRCWRLVRDKHALQRALDLAGVGMLAVLVTAFVPLPGMWILHGTGTQSIVMPQVKAGRLNTDSIMFGDDNGARYASVRIDIEADSALNGLEMGFGEFDLRVVGDENSRTRLQPMLVHQQKGIGMPATNLVLEYRICDRPPGRSGRSSGRSDPEDAKVIAALPRTKARITGTILLKQFHYRALTKGPLDQSFTRRENGYACAFYPPLAGAFRNRGEAIWASYSPPLVTVRPESGFPKVRFRIEDPEYPEISWLDQLSAGSTGRGMLFGNLQSDELRISDRDIEACYHWNMISRKEPGLSVREWKKRAMLVCEVVTGITTLAMPVDVEVEVPDPDKVRNFLLE